MQSEEIRKRFLKFFKERGHAIIPSASLVPENDPSVLFTTAGMQPLVPYLLGQPHPKGNRLANVQKCVRTQDIDEVGDNTHDTFFEMLGNWSLGDYFKKETITWSYEFLTDKKEGLGLDPKRLYITCFAGDENAPRDEESALVWKSLGIPEERIYFRGAKDNWWSPGETGPCGPDTEMFYDVTEVGLGNLTAEEFERADDEQKAAELWNDVFMEYEKKDGKVIGKLKQKNVDTGAGLERLAMVLQGKDNIFETDLFSSLVTEIKKHSQTKNEKAIRIIADHVRTSVFIISDGIMPSNTDRGYVLRRLLRRAIWQADKIGMDTLVPLIETVVKKYSNAYPDISEKTEEVKEVFRGEEKKFRSTLQKGVKEFEKNKERLDGKTVFKLFSTFGLPFEMIEELAQERGVKADIEDAREHLEKHRTISQKDSGGKFKGGLADTSAKTVMLHTATHLMLAGLKKYLGNHVHQSGSNITTERSRFDFTHPEKVPREVLSKVEAYVNEAIEKKCNVVIEEMKKHEAQKAGVEGSFWEKYPNVVHVYKVVCDDGSVYSQELCGGPHVKNTGEIKGTFKIKKEESVAAGIRRVKAVLE